jgi:bacteriocin-like protein
MKTLSRNELKSVTGGMIGDWGSCSSDCGNVEPGCRMVIAVCPGYCVSYAGGDQLACSDDAGQIIGSHPEKFCN